MKHTAFFFRSLYSAAIGIALLPIVIGCSSRRQDTSASATGGDTVSLKYARLLTLVRHDGYVEATIANPWKKGQLLHRYYLVPRADSARFSTPAVKGDVVYTPVRRSVVALSSLCQLAVWLQTEKGIKGVCDCQYVQVPRIRQMLHGGLVADCGSSMAPSVEQVAALDADALFLSPFDNANYGRVAQIGVPVVECAEYMEASALARAEWVRFYGMLWGRERQADSLFCKMERHYKDICREVAHTRSRPGVLTERVSSGTWYCPGGRSTMASMIADAGGRYLFAADTHSGSLPLAPETVVERGAAADVWLFVAAGTKPLSRQQLLAEYHGYSQIKAMQTGSVFQCANLASAYFDELSFRPDYLLQDMAYMFHPELRKGARLRYFQQ